MRKGRNPEIKITDKGLYGFNLSSDATAEHEWGISKLKSLLGMPQLGSEKKYNVMDKISKRKKYNVGIDARTIQTIPDHTLRLEKFVENDENYYVLICYRPWGMKIDITEHSLKAFELYPYPGTNITAAWDESSFGLLVSEVYKGELEDLHQAILNKNVVISANDEKFEGGGLNLIIKSSIDEKTSIEMFDRDMEEIKIKKISEEIGLKEKLRKANKKFLALSPRLAKDFDNISETKYELVYWLNPYEQHIHNYGWFTVEELLQWIDDEGPVIINKKDF